MNRLFPFVSAENEDDRRNNQIGIVSQPPPNKGPLLEVVLVLVLSVGTENKGPMLDVVLRRSLWLPLALSGSLWLSIALQICLPSPCSAHKALAQLGTPFLRSLTLISPVSYSLD